MKKILAVVLSVAALASTTSALASTYSDVPENAWYTGYVNKISELKGFAGYEDNTFRPDNQITQEEFVKTVVALTVGEQPEATGENTEPKRSWKNCWDSWAQPYLNKAMEMGLITEEDTDFRYNGLPCTRGNMAKIATRAFEYLKEEDIADTSTYAAKLKDYSDIPDKFKSYVLQAYGKGIISGYEDGTFRSDGILTRAEASSVLVRLIDKAERPNADETLYDYFGRKVTWTEPLRTDVPEQYQVSIADHKVLSQANYNESVQLGGTPSDYPLNRSKAMMFEDLVLQSIRYDGDTITLTIPDYLPESQRWVISLGYWETDKDYDMTNVKHIKISEPGEYSFSGVKLMGGVIMTVKPQNSDSFTSLIEVTYQKPLSLERLDKPEVSFNNMHTNFEWVQGQGYKDYIKDFDGEIAYPVEW
ncbi:S-layer homology domain-containing protein [Hominilimicola sp.]|uniref:S-layer homology domain-containing protein n=1 Tax=Hominilimicola sp. TaxID=3073571 RepID=UPI00307D7692